MKLPRLSPRGRSRLVAAFLISAVFAGFFGSSSVGLAAPPLPTCNVSGNIVVDTTWDATCIHVLVGNVTVNPGVTLTIKPGVSVMADSFRHLYVRGTLTANGLSNSLITFAHTNAVSLVPWGGIQFNATSAGSITWASISRAERAIYAVQSSPTITDNVIDTAYAGIVLEASSSSALRNRINYTNIAIQASAAGDVTFADNIITNMTGNPALAIYVTNLQSASISTNTIRGVFATNGRTPAIPGSRGTDGGYSVGILVNGTSTGTVVGNTLTQIVGGQGGNGASSSTASGGRGGDGGSAAAIVTFGVSILDVGSNTITGVVGGHGGTGGGSSAATGNGGNGGNGGSAAGIQSTVSATSATWSWNFLTDILGGSGGDGAASSFGTFGSGGVGADTYGFLTGQAVDGDAGSNLVQTVRGGHGGNSSNGARGTSGGSAGQVAALWAFGVDGTGSLHDNLFTDLTGGVGGAGRLSAGWGGNATGVLAVGDGSPYNLTLVQRNTISFLTGGAGGIGTLAGGTGGGVSGFAAIHVRVGSDSNTINTLTGGRGGNAFIIGNAAGRGGDCTAFIAALAPNTASSLDTIQTVTKGAPGTGSGTPKSYAVGVYGIGNPTSRTTLTLTNATLAAIGDFDINVDNYTEATTVNTPFSSAKLAVQRAGNLTVQNFLAVAVYWPNNVTLLAGAHVHVDDDSIAAWDLTSSSGFAPWLLVTDRVYQQSTTTVHDNQTKVFVSYAGTSFWSNPRVVDMASSHTENFGMRDTAAPNSSAMPLPTYENTLTFTVDYTYDDGNGTGVRTVTLWYRAGGGWVQYATQVVPSVGGFSFTAPSDGTYQFYTQATDVAGNVQSAPSGGSGNNTWTIVDTVRPGSHVNALAAYENVLSFVVSWAPDSGVTDIVAYRIQYNAGAGWIDWLPDTHATSGTFTATSQGSYAFRSLARDYAGNIEVPPAGNDTWTIVDTVRPSSETLPLPVYETVSPFVVTWEPREGTFDITTYRIQVNDNGGGWTEWIPTTTATSAPYSGQDGHTYQFRSLATDRAGNVESASGNDSWTIVDMSPPDSTVSVLPPYETALQFTIAWGPVAGTTDIATYRIQVRDGSGAWTDVSGYSSTTATSTTFVGVDGHAYGFRSLAQDRAGNTEVPPAANDTSTVVDVTKPFVTDVAPLGANTNLTPWVVVTFSEPMDRSSVEQAFSITPAMNGAYQWSTDSTRVTFIPARPLIAGTTYFVAVDSSGRDRAGNSMTQSRTFQFSTAGGLASGFSLADNWWLLVLVGALAGGALFLIMRRRAAAPAKPPAVTVSKDSDAIVEDVFLLNHRDGVLIKHETRRLRPDVDTDILSGMLTAVQQFVKDALRGDDYADLNEMTVGHMHILIGRGKWLVLAARIEGDGSGSWTARIERCIKDMEDHHWDQLEDWDGDMSLARVLTPYIKKLISGGYDAQ